MDRKAPEPKSIPDTGNASSFKSEGERRIARTLDHYGIPFVYEPRIPVRDNSVTRYLVPDFYLPRHHAFIEYYGRAGNAEYDRRTQRKESLYAANHIRVLALYPWSLCQDWPARLLDYVDNSTPPFAVSRGDSAAQIRPTYGPRPGVCGYAKTRPTPYR
jgi:hypothetical protein